MGIQNNLFERCLRSSEGDHKVVPTKIFSLNRSLDHINNRALNRLQTKEHSFNLRTRNTSKYASDYFLKSILIPQKLTLKEGCQVMLLHNLDIDAKLVNGSRGVVEELDHEHIVVQFESGQRRMIEIITREIEIDKQVVFSFTQYPLRLAYASTIHKTQGMTLDLLEVDLSNVFAPGQMYVALSRARNLEGLYISKLDWSKLRLSREGIAFYEQLKSD